LQPFFVNVSERERIKEETKEGDNKRRWTETRQQGKTKGTVKKTNGLSKTDQPTNSKEVNQDGRQPGRHPNLAVPARKSQTSPLH
jgi:hypothetical protein